MSTDILVKDQYGGQRVETIDLLDIFPAPEGSINQYYGRIGNGKTYAATSDILDLLNSGAVVYANWKINWNEFDERNSLINILRSLFSYKPKTFFKFKKENLRFIEINENFLSTFEKLTDCHVFLDEGHVAFDSYEMAKMSLRKRQAVLHTRHFNRSISIISQRPTAIHVSMRANVNIFYKCERLLKYPFLLLRRTEFQDITGETVDESQPISTKVYLGSKRVFNAYDSKYLRGDTVASQNVEYEAYELKYIERFMRFIVLLRALFPSLSRKKSAERDLKLDFPIRKSVPLSEKLPLGESLGVDKDIATIKNGRGLNTALIGGMTPDELRDEESQQSLPF